MRIVEFPLVVIREGVLPASVIGYNHDRVLALIPTSNISAYLQVEIMATNMQSTVKRATIRVLGKYYIDPIDSSVDLLHLLSEFIGIVDDKVSRPLIVENILQRQMFPLQTLKHRFDKQKKDGTEAKAGVRE